MSKLQSDDGQYFSSCSHKLLKISKEGMEMCHETHFSDQENGKSIDDIIDEFNNKEQSPFLQA